MSFFVYTQPPQVCTCYNVFMIKPKLFLATDHAGLEHKNALRDYMTQYSDHGYDIVDLGAFVLDEKDDYPVYIAKAARAVSKNPNKDRAVIFGGSGQGEAIVANKFPGVRATVYYGSEPSIIDLARFHNDTNVLSFGARFVSATEVIDLTSKWLVMEFAGEERHKRRLSLIDTLEEKRFWNRFMGVIRNYNK